MNQKLEILQFGIIIERHDAHALKSICIIKVQKMHSFQIISSTIFVTAMIQSHLEIFLPVQNFSSISVTNQSLGLHFIFDTQ